MGRRVWVGRFGVGGGGAGGGRARLVVIQPQMRSQSTCSPFAISGLIHCASGTARSTMYWSQHTKTTLPGDTPRPWSAVEWPSATAYIRRRRFLFPTVSWLGNHQTLTTLPPNTTTLGDAPDWLPLDEVTRVQRAEPHGLDPTHDHDDEVPVRRHGVWAGRGRPGAVGRSRVVIAVCTRSGPKCNTRGKSARIALSQERGELAGPLPSKALRGTLTMRSLPALLTFQTKRLLRPPPQPSPL